MVAKKESEKRFRALVENSSDAIALFAEDGTILYGSPSTSRMLGYSLDEFQGRNAFELIHPDDHESVTNRLAESLRQPGVAIPVQAHVLHKDGRWRWVEGIFTNLLADPSVHAIVNNYRDVTERELAEEALRESEARYRKISELTSDYTYAFRVVEGTDAVLEWASDAVMRVTGYSAEELPTVDLWDRMVYPDDLDKLVQQRRRIFAGEQSGEIEFRIVAKSGDIRWLLNNLLAEWDEAGERIIRVYGVARDISERKRAEAVIQESESRYRLLIEQAADGIFVADTDGRYLDANSKGCQMLGYSRDELLQLNVHDIVIEADVALAPARIEELRAGKTLLSERLMRRKHGVIFPTETSARMLPDGSIQSIIRDISERKRIEAELRLSEERYRIVSELMSDYAYMVRVLPGPDYATQLEWVTGAFTQITGYSIEEAMAGLDWTSSIFPEDAPIVERRRQKMLAGQKDVSEFRMIRKNGEAYWLRSYTHPQWDEGRQRVTRIYSAVQDITERKQAEESLRAHDERFRALVENSSDEMVLVSPEGNILYVAPSSVRVTGYTYEEYVGHNAAEFLHPDDVEATFRQYDSVLQNPRIPFPHQYRIRHRDGHWMWMEGTATNLLDDSAIGAVVVNQRDITERKQAAEALRESEQRLRLVLENMPVMLDAFDERGNLIVWNRECERVTGYTAAELTGNPQTMSLLYPNADYLDKMLGAWNARGNNYYNWEWELVARDGIARTIAWSNISEVLPIAGWPSWGIGVDVTERVQAEAALRRANEELERRVEERTLELSTANALLNQERNLLRTLIDNLPSHVFVKDTNSRFVLFNPGVTQQLGAAASDEVIGKSDFDFYPHEVARKYYEAEQAIIRTGQPIIDQEHYILDPGGGSRWILETKVPLRDSDGKISGLVGLNHNITERKRADEVRRQIEERTRLTIDGAYEAFIAIDDSGAITDWNRQAEAVFGWSRQEILGQSLADTLIPQQHREAHREGIKRFLATGEGPLLNKRIEITALHRDGREFPVEFTITPVQWGDNYIFSAFLHDITERKETEAKLQYQAYLLANVNDAVIASDERFVLTSWNPAAEKMYGWKAEEVLGKVGQEVLRSEFIGVERAEAISRLVETGQLHAELIQYRKDGPPIYVEGDVIALKDQGGRTTGYLSVNRDITERKRAEDEIRKLNVDLERRAAELESANKELEAFSYSVSHDLRAPLRAMDGFSRILLTDYAPQLDADAQRYLNLVRDNAQQMGELISGLLNFSRLGRQGLQKQPVNLTDLVQRVMQDLLAEWGDREIELTVGDLPVGKADPILLKQVFLNLLQNALKFTRQRDLTRIEVGSQQVEGESVYYVKDNGVGFDMRYAHKLFGVFQRMHRAEDFEGVGVGLATVQRIVHRHGGRVWAESELDKGATFYFTLALGGGDGRE